MDLETKKKYELLKAKNKNMMYEKNWERNGLFMECIDLLEKHSILSKEKSEELFRELQMLIPFKNGRVDWEKITNSSRISIKEFEKYNKIDKQYFVMWDSHDVPCVYCGLQSIIDNLDDILAVSSNTWLLSEDKDEIFEFYHEGEIMHGIMDSK